MTHYVENPIKEGRNDMEMIRLLLRKESGADV